MLCEKKDCFGCGACVNACKFNAITMFNDERGFIHPKINDSVCVKCGMCEQACPALVSNKINSPIDWYAGWNKNKLDRKKSSSGGVFILFAKYVLDKDGLVAGCLFDGLKGTKHCLSSDLDTIKQFCGSKYSQSSTGFVFKEIKDVLNNGKTVLFSGTPCQCAALKCFLGKEYANLLLIDFFCHGVPPYSLLEKHIKSIHNNKAQSIWFRKKLPYWDEPYIEIKYQDGYIYRKRLFDDPYFKIFNESISLRDCCYNCPFIGKNKASDISLGDYWSYKPKSLKFANYNKGISIFTVNTQKGFGYFETIKDKLNFETTNYGDCSKGNKALLSFPVNNFELRNSFWNDINEGKNFEIIDKKYCKQIKKQKFLFLRRIIRKYKWLFNEK